MGSGLAFWNAHQGALDLFRNGGFATLDEFCKLAGPQFQNEIIGLKRLVRAALGLFNPEEQFEGSEYYAFVQALFKDDLTNLREDVTVLTYNYDPYLEFLMFRALETRRQVNRRGKGLFISEQDLQDGVAHQNKLNSVTSGLYALNNFDWQRAEPSFCILQLHGSIGFVLEEVASFEILFEEPNHNKSEGVLRRAQCLFQGKANEAVPPLFFPWEVMTEKGFVEKTDFPLQGHFPLFRGIWERARRDVQAANKISFVGLSMHPFLKDGLRFLFNGKPGPVEVVVANPENLPFVRGQGQTHWSKQPHSPGFAVNRVLNEIAPNMQRAGGDITLVNDFSGFIKTQMKQKP
jgi:hypothetical protein